MKTGKEVLDYLGIEDTSSSLEILKESEIIQREYEDSIKTGKVGYCLLEDFDSKIYPVEPPNKKLEKIKTLNHLVVYSIN